MFKVTIDGIEVEVPEGTTILNAARKIGPEVASPTMRHYSSLETSGGYCRTCLGKLEVTKGSEKSEAYAQTRGFLQNYGHGRHGGDQ